MIKLLIPIIILFSSEIHANSVVSSPSIAFSFDDGSTQNYPNFPNHYWNSLLLNTLKKHQLKAAFFVTKKYLGNSIGRQILEKWNNQGHLIANHTNTHPNFNSSTPELFKQELLSCDSFIRKYSNYYPYFRFPYLKEGKTRELIQSYRKILEENNYKNGHVSIDASDWYISKRLIDKLKLDSTINIDGFKDYYIQHLFDRALFYDSVSTQLFNRKVKHVILLHHNLAAALFLDDLILHFKHHGWNIINIDEAYQDKLYQLQPENIPAGESIIWTMAKMSGKFENILRYPAEDSQYEKEIMDKLGL